MSAITGIMDDGQCVWPVTASDRVPESISDSELSFVIKRSVDLKVFVIQPGNGKDIGRMVSNSVNLSSVIATHGVW